MAEKTTLRGMVQSVVYRGNDGFAVFRVRDEETKKAMTVAGNAPDVAEEAHVTVSGIWQVHERFGEQFKASEVGVTPPTTADGIETYLASGFVKAIGPVTARRIVTQFGDDTLDVLDKSPDRLAEVRGIGRQKADEIAKNWQDQRSVREVMIFLRSCGLGAGMAGRIHARHGPASVRLLEEDPYQIAQTVDGIGFQTADQIAAHLGITGEDPRRMRAAVRQAAVDAADQGHCGLPVKDIVTRAHKLLRPCNAHHLVRALRECFEEDSLVEGYARGQRCAFLPGLYHREQQAAQRLSVLSQTTPAPVADAPADSVAWAEGVVGKEFHEGQREALAELLNARVGVLTGGPGTGKTTVLDGYVHIIERAGLKPTLSAPTGRAAKRMKETTGRPAKTIHKLLEAGRHGFQRNADNPVEADIIVIDESSMLDSGLFRHLLDATPDHARLLFVGDVDQLPSVGPGAVLRDLIDSGTVPVGRLTHVFRQAAESNIVQAAHDVNEGRVPRRTGKDYAAVKVNDPDHAAEVVRKLVTEQMPRYDYDPIRHVQVLTPMLRGSAGVEALNNALQAELNPTAEPRVRLGAYTYAPGDRIMIIKNNHDEGVSNGDVGWVKAIDTENEMIEFWIDEGDEKGLALSYGFDRAREFTLNYACTIHKAQGSEYPVVVMPLTTGHYPMLAKSLTYTALTRAQSLCITVAQPKAYQLAVQESADTERWSHLREALEETMPPLPEATDTATPGSPHHPATDDVAVAM